MLDAASRRTRGASSRGTRATDATTPPEKRQISFSTGDREEGHTDQSEQMTPIIDSREDASQKTIDSYILPNSRHSCIDCKGVVLRYISFLYACKKTGRTCLGCSRHDVPILTIECEQRAFQPAYAS